MIPVTRPLPENEPELFDINCRQPGKAWLESNAKKDPHSQNEWWSMFQPALAKLFEYRCGWQAVRIGLGGEVDHWVACSQDRSLAFEWSNYRYISSRINTLKSAGDGILDPCDVEAGWFAVTLPDFQLVTTDLIPPSLKQKAEDTLKQLQLRNGHHARWARWDCYCRAWKSGGIDIDWLRVEAPLVADAVERALLLGDALPVPADSEPKNIVAARQRRYGPRTSRRKDAQVAQVEVDLKVEGDQGAGGGPSQESPADEPRPDL